MPYYFRFNACSSMSRFFEWARKASFTSHLLVSNALDRRDQNFICWLLSIHDYNFSIEKPIEAAFQRNHPIMTAMFCQLNLRRWDQISIYCINSALLLSPQTWKANTSLIMLWSKHLSSSFNRVTASLVKRLSILFCFRLFWKCLLTNWVKLSIQSVCLLDNGLWLALVSF